MTENANSDPTPRASQYPDTVAEIRRAKTDERLYSVVDADEGMGESAARVEPHPREVWNSPVHLPSPALTPAGCSPQLSPANPEDNPKDDSEYESDGRTSTRIDGQVDDTSPNDSLRELPVTAPPGVDFIPIDHQGNEHRTRTVSGTKTSASSHVRRLSASKIQELTAAPGSLPIATIPDHELPEYPMSASAAEAGNCSSFSAYSQPTPFGALEPAANLLQSDGSSGRVIHSGRPGVSIRTLSTPPTNRRKYGIHAPSHQPAAARRNSFNPAAQLPPLDLGRHPSLPPSTPKSFPAGPRPDTVHTGSTSPIPPSIPLPPMSIPTLLQLELAGQRPSPLYIHHSHTADTPYESSAVKFERLKNFLLLPWFVEWTLSFGALACLDAWLWTFTILPMRFCAALSVLTTWWAYLIGKEARWLVDFVWYGVGRVWRRGRRGRSASRSGNRGSGRSSNRRSGEESRSRSRARTLPNGTPTLNLSAQLPSADLHPETRRQETPRLNGECGPHRVSKRPGLTASKPKSGVFQHKRTKSVPSSLTSFHKADLLQGAVIICSSIALMNLDASRMYHLIRAQSTIKLYAIYNLLEVGDRLLSALGQDILECLFSSETLSRNSSGRSKVLLPFGMFLLTLVYNVAHSVTLFYQVITLNVAINSYSNALLTLLMSNQVVEVKSSVFKRFEKENTFQLMCADIVERFQLWIMLLIIGMRNVVEVGGLSVPGAGNELSSDGDSSGSIPLHTSSILPASFTVLPSWLWSGEVLSPFLIVIGSEMLVDWIKHAYVTKFNNIKPNFYNRILDILCKDYYTNAFVTPFLTRRLGLPLLPLSCLFIRASVQTYHMFLATHLPAPLPPSTQTSLSVESATPSSPAVVAALDRLDMLIRNALGRAVYGYPYGEGGTDGTVSGRILPWLKWTTDDLIAGITMVVVFFLGFLVLLVAKLVLGMVLLRYSRDRYAKMKAAEQSVATGKAERETYDMKGARRVGGYSQVEVGEGRRRWLYDDDIEGLKAAKEKARKAERGDPGKEKDISGVSRYEMIARRIW